MVTTDRLLYNTIPLNGYSVMIIGNVSNIITLIVSYKNKKWLLDGEKKKLNHNKRISYS